MQLVLVLNSTLPAREQGEVMSELPAGSTGSGRRSRTFGQALGVSASQG